MVNLFLSKLTLAITHTKKMKIKASNFINNASAMTCKRISTLSKKGSSFFKTLIAKGKTIVSQLKNSFFFLSGKMRGFISAFYLAIQRSILFIKESIGHLLNKISLFVARISPLGYIGQFILLILLYSIFYYLLPARSLYHSTSQFEYDYLTPDANNILFSIRQRVIQNFTNYYGGTKAEINGWELDINEVNIYSLDVKNLPENVGFGLTLPVSYTFPDKHHAYTEIRTKVIIPANEYIRMDDIISFFIETQETSLQLRTMGIPQIPSSKDLFHLDESLDVSKVSGVLSLPVNLWNQVLDFGQVYRGFPERGTGQYIRMLYLSAGIATSSAFGDIVPTTTLSRTLVFSEAVFSIILVGLFLNSVGNIIAKSVISSSKSLSEK